jgi:hypothetical protein
MSAACVRADMLACDGATEGQAAIELAEHFCRGAQRRVGQHFHQLWRNDDDENYQAAQRVLDGRYTWSEAGVLDPSLLAPTFEERT